MMKGVESSSLSRRYGSNWFEVSTAGPKRLCVSPAGPGRDERHGETRERRIVERTWAERLPGDFEKIAG